MYILIKLGEFCLILKNNYVGKLNVIVRDGVDPTTYIYSFNVKIIFPVLK